MKQSLAKSLTKGFVFFALIVAFGFYVNASKTVEYGGEREAVKGSSIQVFNSVKCDDVPVGEFPTGAVIRYADGHTGFSKVPGDVNYLFKVSVGEQPLNPIYREFTLCK